MRKKYLSTLSSLISPKRFEHSLRVEQAAIKLAKKHNLNQPAVGFAGLFHDIAKESTPADLLALGVNCNQFNECWVNYPSVWHAFVGPLVVSHVLPEVKLNYEDAIRFHTTGQKNMSVLAEIIFVADFIEPGRKHPDRSMIESVAMDHLASAVALITQKTIERLTRKNAQVHPFTLSCAEWYAPFLE